MKKTDKTDESVQVSTRFVPSNRAGRDVKCNDLETSESTFPLENSGFHTKRTLPRMRGSTSSPSSKVR